MQESTKRTISDISISLLLIGIAVIITWGIINGYKVRDKREKETTAQNIQSGYEAGVKATQIQAVSNGCARWKTDVNGNVTFEWIYQVTK